MQHKDTPWRESWVTALIMWHNCELCGLFLLIPEPWIRTHISMRFQTVNPFMSLCVWAQGVRWKRHILSKIKSNQFVLLRHIKLLDTFLLGASENGTPIVCRFSSHSPFYQSNKLMTQTKAKTGADCLGEVRCVSLSPVVTGGHSHRSIFTCPFCRSAFSANPFVMQISPLIDCSSPVCILYCFPHVWSHPHTWLFPQHAFILWSSLGFFIYSYTFLHFVFTLHLLFISFSLTHHCIVPFSPVHFLSTYLAHSLHYCFSPLSLHHNSFGHSC